MAKKATPSRRTEKVNAGPAKRFFVWSLTRDIELADAILDLLDNCVDGIVRDLKRKSKSNTERSFKGYWAKIIAKPDRFEIWDNCGGIPKKVAKKYAFMLGRPRIDADDDIETVGVYGIGMKRAMFKIGLDSVVTSQTSDDSYSVHISEEWINDDDDWNLRLRSISRPFASNGTKIEITKLNDEIKHQFSENSTFVEDLEKTISQHYALIMDKGFSVYLNNNTEKIKPVKISILAPKKISQEKKEAISPYLFNGNFNDVSVEVAVGFYRPLATDRELEEYTNSSKSQNAGWTVICNNRIVVYNDKTIVTGWGAGGIPSYHNQFISICGVVVFNSVNSEDLPLKTTKRGIDTSSEMYQIVRGYMQKGVQKFTQFTNKWKKQPHLTNKFFDELAPVSGHTIVKKLLKQVNRTKVRKHQDKGEAWYYAPDLPKPKRKDGNVRICFDAKKHELATVAEYYFENGEAQKSEIGRACFEDALDAAKGEKE